MSKIEWTDETWNPIAARDRETGRLGSHCEKVSPACAHCYAETFNGRKLPNHGTGLKYTRENRDRVEIVEPNMEQPLHWKNPRKVFVCSMTDLFGEFVPDELIDQVFAVMALCTQHTFQVLTKRPERALEWFNEDEEELAQRLGSAVGTLLDGDWVWGPGKRLRGKIEEFISLSLGYENDDSTFAAEEVPFPLPNVWIGVTAEDRQRADERIPKLLEIPAAKRFVSYEPALGLVDFTCLHHEGMVEVDALNGTHGVVRPHRGTNERLDWIICGGESGPGARPMHPDWARLVRDQCKAAGVPFFFKQWGAWAPHPNGETSVDRAGGYCTGSGLPPEPSEALMDNVGKKSAGRLLDGREWMEFPQ